jgi:Putative peptidoglycan binding domain
METHTVEQGDCLSNISDMYGFADYHTIYDHPANADLKSRRPNPNVLYPGDLVVIPDKQQKEVSCSTGQLHNFQVNRPSAVLRVRIQDDQNKPFTNKKYHLSIDGVLTKGQTDGDGMIVQKISPAATKGDLLVWIYDDPGAPGVPFPLDLGHLDPVTEISGVQARLNNLGFDCGSVDGIFGPDTEDALRAFQSQMGLPITGQSDSATQSKLTQLHDGA